MGDKHLGLGKEAVYATAVPATTWLEIQSEGVRREPRFIPANTIRSVSPRAQSLGGVVTRGPFQGLINYQDFPSLAYYMLGDVATTGPVSSHFTHTIPAAAPGFIRPSFTMEIQRDLNDGGETHKYQGCVMTELSFLAAVNEISVFSAGLVGAGTEATGTPTSPTYPTLDLVLPSECVVSVDAAAKSVERWSLEISWPVDEPVKLGSTSLARKPRDSDVMKVSGSFTLLQYDAIHVWNKFNTYGTADLQLVATGAASDTLTINVDQVKFLTGHGHLEGRTTPKPEIRWEAFLNPTISSPIQIIGVNNLATLP